MGWELSPERTVDLIVSGLLRYGLGAAVALEPSRQAGTLLRPGRRLLLFHHGPAFQTTKTKGFCGVFAAYPLDEPLMAAAGGRNRIEPWTMHRALR